MSVHVFGTITGTMVSGIYDTHTFLVRANSKKQAVSRFESLRSGFDDRDSVLPQSTSMEKIGYIHIGTVDELMEESENGYFATTHEKIREPWKETGETPATGYIK